MAKNPRPCDISRLEDVVVYHHLAVLLRAEAGSCSPGGTLHWVIEWTTLHSRRQCCDLRKKRRKHALPLILFPYNNDKSNFRILHTALRNRYRPSDEAVESAAAYLGELNAVLFRVRLRPAMYFPCLEIDQVDRE